MEFLGEHGVVFESVEITGSADARSRWEAAGRPVVPSLWAGGVVTPVLHVSQLALVLGVEPPPGEEAGGLAWDLAALLERWRGRIAGVDLSALTEPTASRGRSIRNLTVNVFHPVSLLPGAWDSGRFDWDPDEDGEREQRLTTAVAVRAYAAGIAAAWTGFLLEEGDAIGLRDPTVVSPRGQLSYAELLASQRGHAAFHLEQLPEQLA